MFLKNGRKFYNKGVSKRLIVMMIFSYYYSENSLNFVLFHCYKTFYQLNYISIISKNSIKRVQSSLLPFNFSNMHFN